MISRSSGGVMRRATPEMNVSRGVHNRSIFVLIPTFSNFRVTVVQRRQQNRKFSKIHSGLPLVPLVWWNTTVQDFQHHCARSREKLRRVTDYSPESPQLISSQATFQCPKKLFLRFFIFFSRFGSFFRWNPPTNRWKSGYVSCFWGDFEPKSAPKSCKKIKISKINFFGHWKVPSDGIKHVRYSWNIPSFSIDRAQIVDMISQWLLLTGQFWSWFDRISVWILKIFPFCCYLWTIVTRRWEGVVIQTNILWLCTPRDTFISGVSRRMTPPDGWYPMLKLIGFHENPLCPSHSS